MATTTRTTIDDLHSDVITRALRHMDGPTLAAASCATSRLCSLSSDPSIWRDLCLSTWPSLRHPRLLSLLSGAHRSFFSQSFPFPLPIPDDDDAVPVIPTHLISAIDLYHRGNPVFSRFVDTDTSSSWFLSSPFRIDGLDRKDPDPYPSTEPAINPEDLTLSWTVIDPDSRLAVNVSSRRPVSIDRHWYTGEILVRFAVILKGWAVSAVVTCGDETGHVREVGLTVEDMDGAAASGRESLGVLKMAMEGGRRAGEEEVKVRERYEEYLRKKRERKEMKVRREGILDLCCTAFGALVFLAFLMLLAFR